MGTEKLLFRFEQPHGMGDIYMAWQKGSGMYLATTGIDSIINIFDRYGEIQERIRLPSLCTGFEWDSDGDLLAAICQSQPQLVLWDANTSKKNTIDVGLKDQMSCLVWAKTSKILVVGTSKGNISIYDHNLSKRIPVIGKHTKKITCGAWNNDNLLALGSEDKTISISNAEGDTLRVVSLRAEPSELHFSDMKTDESSGSGGENTISLLVGKKTLYLYNLLDPENPIELAFQQHYGLIVNYRWFGDGYILMGFGGGFFITISTHIKEVGQELFQIRNHKNSLTDIAVCHLTGKAASCGDNSVKIHDLANLQETSAVLTLSQESGVDRIGWSSDGQLLAVATRNGSLNVYVSHMEVLTSACAPRMAVLSSLTEVSLYNYTSDKSKLKPIPIALEVEPGFIAVGPYHLAAGMNNRIWFYDLTKPQPGTQDAPLKLKDRQYLGAVTGAKLNSEYVSVLFEARLQLHLIEPPEVLQQDKETILFPDNQNESVTITCHELTSDFLIYATDMGHLIYFCIEEWAKAAEYKHDVGITDLYADLAGTRLVFVDVKTKAYLYDVVSNQVMVVPELPPGTVAGVIWDSNISERNVFIIHDQKDIFTYVYSKISIKKPSVKKVGQTTLVSKQTPLLMYSGEVMSATSGGQLTQLTLASHDSIQIRVMDKDGAQLEINFHKQVALQRFEAAIETCRLLNSTKLSEELAKECLHHLEIQTAIRIYKDLGDVPMVWKLESVSDVEDLKLLCGYIAMYLGNYDEAQSWFAESSQPSAALEMRRDLLQWDQALQLAKKMAPEQIAMISREYAQQLEFVGNYAEALRHYEKGLQENLSLEHIDVCKAGIARTNLHCGNYRHGTSIAVEMDNKQLLKECADILEKRGQLLEAAQLLERCQQYDRAASNYIQLKKWSKVGELLPNVNSNKILLQFAKAKEDEAKYEEAAWAYQKAKDVDSLIRLHLEHLNNPEVAVELVQETRSVQGARMVAKFFQNLNDIASAIRFLVISKCAGDEALELAKKNGKMALYGEILLDTFSEDELRVQDLAKVAAYFEGERNSLLAGKYWFHAKEYQKSMRHLLKAAKTDSKEKEAIGWAIDVAAASNDQSMSDMLIEFLLGETDGLPKDPKYLFRLYMARKQFREASKSALIIANEEQINGNYRNAHDVLLAMCQELKQNAINVPQDMYANLMLLHSYILVRMHVKRGDHLRGARLLIRVADNVSKFPSHVVPILTSTVIECHRAGLRHAAHKYATLLMKPEYRKNIDPKYAKKIEAVVRRPPKSENIKTDGEEKGEIVHGDPLENLTPCPYCDNLLPETEVACSCCKNNIPFCIVTGGHIIKNDLTACPECDFPAIHSEFDKILENDRQCPMCSEKVDPGRLVRVTDPKHYLGSD